MRRMLVAWLAAPLALASSGCGSSTAAATPTTPTLVAVSPAEFAGSVPCTDATGAMRGYVVTLYDRGTRDAPTDPFALPSSVIADSAGTYRATPCERTAAFAFVIPGHRYDAEIDAYDRSDLHALGPGSRLLVDDASGAYVGPRWTTTCGREDALSAASGPVTAALYLTRFVHGCAPLTAHAPETPTGISVGLSDALAGLACGEAAGQVSSFDVALVGASDPPKPAKCGATVEFTGLVAGTSYNFDVRAYESGAALPRWTTSCFRVALQGAIVSAACDPLNETK